MMWLMVASAFAMDVRMASQVKQGHVLKIEVKPFATGLKVVMTGNRGLIIPLKNLSG